MPARGDRWVAERAPATPGKVCKDCAAENVGRTGINARPAPHPGPRCATHHKAEQRRRRLANKARRVERDFGIPPELYDELYAFQGGQCALRCGAKGTGGKRLAVDHDHHQAMLDGHHPDKGCRNCVRGLVCSTCNDVLAHARSNPAYFRRGESYLNHWPLRQLLAGGTFGGIPVTISESRRMST